MMIQVCLPPFHRGETAGQSIERTNLGVELEEGNRLWNLASFPPPKWQLMTRVSPPCLTVA